MGWLKSVEERGVENWFQNLILKKLILNDNILKKFKKLVIIGKIIREIEIFRR